MDVTYQAQPTIWDIECKGWKKLYSQLYLARIEIVCEFYAKTAEHENYKTKVQGKTVAFDSRSINRFYQLPDEDDNYSRIVEQLDYGDILNVLPTQSPNLEWTYVKD